jgi:hypothetical protein
MSLFEKAIVKTLAYSDIFDFPLTVEELTDKLIGYKLQKSDPDIKVVLSELLSKKIIGRKDNYFFLKNRIQIVKKRIERKKYNIQKFAIAQKAADIFTNFPIVKLIALSGAVSVYNADINDDIDFYVVCERNSLWTTRFLVTSVLDIFNYRRKPQGKINKDKICLNMFTTTDSLCVPVIERNIFTANEVINLKPLLDKDGTYLKFLSDNLWVKKYLPNSLKNIKETQKQKFPVVKYSILEKFLKKLQLKYMSKKITVEKIKEDSLSFHKFNHKNMIINAYNIKLKRLKI